MAEELTSALLKAACRPGGASVLTIVTELAPAAGPQGGVAPARYTSGRDATYAYEQRYIDGEAQVTVLIDSKQSQLNRVEEQLAHGIRDGVAPYTSIPRIRLVYGDESYLDMELPHRAWDGHIRAGSIEGKPATQDERYVAARNATPANAMPVLNLSPISLPLGSWDSTRSAHQARYRSALVGEIIGVLADQSTKTPATPMRGGARRDEISPSVQLTGPEMKALLDAQRDELSANNVKRIEESIRKGKDKVSGSTLGLGSIPPSLEALGLIACKRIIRSQVLSFAALRQLRFGGTPEDDVTCRVLLAALALAGVTRANGELVLRANCDLVESAEPVVELDQRGGRKLSLAPLTVDDMDALLSEAISEANRLDGVHWDGHELVVTGNPAIFRGAQADAEE